MAVRINAIPASGFRHGGLEAGKAWAPIEAAGLKPSAREALRDFHGRFVRVHPDDVTKLGELGLAFDGAGKPLRDVTPTKPGPKFNTQHNAPKGDEKKER